MTVLIFGLLFIWLLCTAAFHSKIMISSSSKSLISKASKLNHISKAPLSLVARPIVSNDNSYRGTLRAPTRLFDYKGFGRKISTPSKVSYKGEMVNRHEILIYPHPKLRAENDLVTVFDAELAQLCKELFATMYTADGVGLAAPQVGINKRIMVFNELGSPEFADKEMALINAKIISKSFDTELGDEGCLSFPGVGGRVPRHKTIEVEYQDISGKTHVQKFEELAARIFQHEYDHLDRTLFIDRLIMEDRRLFANQIKKLIKDYGEGGAI